MGSTVHRFQDYWMRSHSETRWAGFMDALGIQWIYEPEPINTRLGWYLPDFYLPGAGVYVEVKGPHPTEVELDKARDLQAATGCPVIFAWGDMEYFGAKAVSGGRLGCFGPNGFAEYSTYELGVVIQSGLGQPYYHRYLRSGIKEKGSPVAMIGDLLQQRLAAWLGRSAMEKANAEHHRALNRARMADLRALTKAEWALSMFFRRPAAGVRHD
jgi:hypothetical protein